MSRQPGLPAARFAARLRSGTERSTVKIALDPCIHRSHSLEQLPALVETFQPAVDMIRTVDSDRVKFLYCAPHTFYFGDDTREMIRAAAPVLAHVHVGDTFNHKASSGFRYIVNPPGSKARVQQHLDIGQGEVPWDDYFGTLAEVGFDGIMTACVFAWEERADESSRFMREEMQRYVDKHFV